MEWCGGCEELVVLEGVKGGLGLEGVRGLVVWRL